MQISVTQHKKGRGQNQQATRILALLAASYTLSFMDRTALSVLQERVKYDLQLADWQLGMMTGPAFAILYSLAGLPLARLAERLDRRSILAVCLIVWSGMTMACGLARSFTEMLIARMGVGIGEAGGNPVAHSIMADVFAPARRVRAIAIYSLGAPVGAFLGAAMVGLLAQYFDWRTAFLLLGPPGFFLALTVLWLMPRVSRCTGEASSVEPVQSLAGVARTLAAKGAFRHSAAGASLVVLTGYGVAAFLAPLMLRQHGLPMATVGIVTGLINGAAAAIGTLLGGYLSSRLGQHTSRATTLVPTAAACIGAPLLMLGCVWHDTTLAVLLLFAGTLSIYCYLAPTFALVYELAPPGTHATSTALFYLVLNLVGTGMGPPMIGALSDLLAHQAYRADGIGAFAEICRATRPVDLSESCAAAIGSGLSRALFCASSLLVWAGFHFWRASQYEKQSALLRETAKSAIA